MKLRDGKPSIKIGGVGVILRLELLKGRLAGLKRSDLLLKSKKWIRSEKLVWTYKLT